MAETDYFANNLWHLQEIGDRLREDADRLEAAAKLLRSRADAIDGAKVNLNRYRHGVQTEAERDA